MWEFENDYIMWILFLQELSLHCIWTKLAEKYPCFKGKLYFPVKTVICYNHCRRVGKCRLTKEKEEKEKKEKEKKPLKVLRPRAPLTFFPTCV